MKNFYYEKCRKSNRRTNWPINRRKAGIRYYHKRHKRWRNCNENSIFMYKGIPQVITACETKFVVDVTHPHDTTYGGSKPNQTIQCIQTTSLAQMDAIVDRYNKRNPSYHFEYDPSKAYVTFYGRHHNYLGCYHTKQIFYPCQKFGSSRYAQFRNFKFGNIRMANEKIPSELPF